MRDVVREALTPPGGVCYWIDGMGFAQKSIADAQRQHDLIANAISQATGEPTMEEVLAVALDALVDWEQASDAGRQTDDELRVRIADDLKAEALARREATP